MASSNPTRQAQIDLSGTAMKEDDFIAELAFDVQMAADEQFLGVTLYVLPCELDSLGRPATSFYLQNPAGTIFFIVDCHGRSWLITCAIGATTHPVRLLDPNGNRGVVIDDCLQFLSRADVEHDLGGSSSPPPENS
jgi:hypothetical protein